MKQQEGKLPLSITHFKYFARSTLTATCDFKLNLFAHAFMTITWSLVARSMSTGLAGFAMFGWDGDAMTLKLPYSKSVCNLLIRLILLDLSDCMNR